MKSFCLLIVLTLCAATYIVSAHSNNTTQPIFFHDVGDHGNNPHVVTDLDNEIAFALATLFGMEAAEIVYPGIEMSISGCIAPLWQEMCEDDMWVPQGIWDQCISCYEVCWFNCADCDWWIFCTQDCQWNLYLCTDGEIDLT